MDVDRDRLTETGMGMGIGIGIPVKSAIIICHCVELTRGSVVWDLLVLLCGTTFLALISIQTSASSFCLEVLKQQYLITYFNLSYVPHDIVLLMYNYW